MSSIAGEVQGRTSRGDALIELCLRKDEARMILQRIESIKQSQKTISILVLTGGRFLLRLLSRAFSKSSSLLVSFWYIVRKGFTVFIIMEVTKHKVERDVLYMTDLSSSLIAYSLQ